MTGACNDHSPLPPRHRDSLAATSKTTPVLPRPLPLPTRENVYGERHVRSIRRKDVGGMRMCSTTHLVRLVCGVLGHFLFVSFHVQFLSDFQKKISECYDNCLINIITK